MIVKTLAKVIAYPVVIPLSLVLKPVCLACCKSSFWWFYNGFDCRKGNVVQRVLKFCGGLLFGTAGFIGWGWAIASKELNGAYGETYYPNYLMVINNDDS